LLSIPLLGVIPESEWVLQSSNTGVPVIMEEVSTAGQAYSDAVARFLGETKPHRFLDARKRGFFERLFGDR
jgi:septum site-determining protein MinD